MAADKAAALRPAKRLGAAAPNRAANGDSRGRDAKTLRSRIADLDDANIENLILRSGSDCDSHKNDRAIRAETLVSARMPEYAERE